MAGPCIEVIGLDIALDRNLESAEGVKEDILEVLVQSFGMTAVCIQDV